MKKFTIQAVFLLFVIGISLFLFQSGSTGNLNLPFLPQKPKTANLKINNAVLKVEVADTAQKRSKGLAGRESLASDEGMLFVFDKADKYPFWMKGLKFALDFVWIKDETVADILEQVPPPSQGQSDSSLPVYSSKVEINKILEVSAGTVSRLNIKTGDKIEIN